MREKDYYARRAPEYEAIYERDDPVRRGEQEALAAAMCAALRGRTVLEVACGTGYWTERLVGAAARIVALDAAPETLAVARAKPLLANAVELREGDAYALADVPGEFDGALAAFWISHVPRARLDGFLRGLHAKLAPGSPVFLADNVFVPGTGGELIVRAGVPDTFKLRTLAEGTKWEIVKNYHDEAALRALLAPHATDVRVHVGRCFYWADYRVSGPT